MDWEAFEAAAYAYRSWPAHDLPGVAARFEELKELVRQALSGEYMEGYGDGQEVGG